MQTPKTLSRWAAGLVIAAGAAFGGPSQAAWSYSSLTVFGDNLSDTGNVFLATGGTVPPAPYFSGRFSDGPVWIDHLAGGLGLPAGAVPSLAGGGNFAFGGARTGLDTSPVPDLMVQIQGMAFADPAKKADKKGLYVLVGGGNDMRDARTAFPTMSAADIHGRQLAAETAVANLGLGLDLLAERGARHVLISNLPDLGRSIEAVALGLEAASTDATNRFNGELSSLMELADHLGVRVSFLDMAGVTSAIFDDATANGGAEYGITNVVAPCNGFAGSPNVPQTACAISGFSDALHPSAAGHRFIGEAALAAAVPEPHTYALMALGLVALLMSTRRRTTARR